MKNLANKPLNIVIVSNSQVRNDIMSGGDRILIECAKRWAEKGQSIDVITSEDGHKMFKRYGLDDVKYILIPSGSRKLSLYLSYILSMLNACVLSLRIPYRKNLVVYSSSDFWPDSIPAWFLKMRFKRAKWIASFYLFAPNPLSKESPYNKKSSLRGLVYYLSQSPVYYLAKKYADMVWVTNELDRWRFIDVKRLTPDRVVAVQGGVDTRTLILIPEPAEKRFDAVFIGRFHPQKGVLELVDIWRFVCARRKSAMLAVIGVGDLERELRKKISDYGLENNVALFGFKDGVEKLRIFKNSRVVVHPAIYDSGGMAACEAMACGLPGVSFDLPALKSYYPKGILKTPCFDLRVFAENILKLFNNEVLYKKTSEDALVWAKE